MVPIAGFQLEFGDVKGARPNCHGEGMVTVDSFEYPLSLPLASTDVVA
jgi:hypothetical protein